MALTLATARLFAEWIVKHEIGGRCLELGRQEALFSPREVARVVRSAGSMSGPSGERLRNAVARLEGGGTRGLRGADFWQAFGFDEVRAVDASGFEGADIIHDMNLPGLARVAGDRFDFVMETGTAEHVFHVPNYLENVRQVTKSGGCIAHVVPANNYVDHGFYQFSPTLFLDYYGAAGCDIMECCLVTSRGENWRRWRILPYVAGTLDRADPSRFAKQYVLFAVLVRKTESLDECVIPQQRIYQRDLNWVLERDDGLLDRCHDRRVLDRPFLREEGFCWQSDVSALVPEGDETSNPYSSRLVLLEDGRPLGPAHSLHREIRAVGRGRYSHWNGTLYFSTSDNTDPNVNDRSYEIAWLR